MNRRELSLGLSAAVFAAMLAVSAMVTGCAVPAASEDEVASAEQSLTDQPIKGQDGDGAGSDVGHPKHVSVIGPSHEAPGADKEEPEPDPWVPGTDQAEPEPDPWHPQMRASTNGSSKNNP
jgi:hypothetical protein